MRIRSYLVFICFFGLSACMGYDGPRMGQVMSQYCQDNSRFEDFYNCVNRNWYQPVAAAGESGNGLVIQAMAIGQNLLNGVKTGQISDAEAIYRWQATQMQMRRQEDATAARQSQALQHLATTVQNYGKGQTNQATGGYIGQSSATAYLKNQYTKGFSKICVYDRLGSVESITIGSTQLCPINR